MKRPARKNNVPPKNNSYGTASWGRAIRYYSSHEVKAFEEKKLLAYSIRKLYIMVRGNRFYRSRKKNNYKKKIPKFCTIFISHSYTIRYPQRAYLRIKLR